MLLSSLAAEGAGWADAGWIGIGANSILVGLFAWLMKHVFSHTIPRLAGAFEKSSELQRNAFETLALEQRTAFREELAAFRKEAAAEREAFRVELREERATLRSLTETIHKHSQALEALKEDLSHES